MMFRHYGPDPLCRSRFHFLGWDPDLVEGTSMFQGNTVHQDKYIVCCQGLYVCKFLVRVPFTLQPNHARVYLEVNRDQRIQVVLIRLYDAHQGSHDSDDSSDDPD